MKFALDGVARAQGTSRGDTRGEGGPCAMRGGGEAVQEGKSGAAGLAGFENRGGGGTVRRGEKMRRHEEGNGSRGSQGSLSAR